MYRIRKLKQKDMQACHDIQHSSHFAKYTGWSEYFWKNVCHHFTDSWVVINDSDEVVGYVVGIIKHDDDLEGRLCYFWIDTCFRKDVKGTGCADELMHFLQERYPEQTARHHFENKRVMKWIENHGWKPVKDIPNVYDDGTPATLVTWNSDDV